MNVCSGRGTQRSYPELKLSLASSTYQHIIQQRQALVLCMSSVPSSGSPETTIINGLAILDPEYQSRGSEFGRCSGKVIYYRFTI
jgi:hypothetical protein